MLNKAHGRSFGQCSGLSPVSIRDLGVLVVFVVGVVTAGCGDDPPPAPSSDPCGDRCVFGTEVCDRDLGICLPVGGGDAGTDLDAGTDTTTDDLPVHPDTGTDAVDTNLDSDEDSDDAAADSNEDLADGGETEDLVDTGDLADTADTTDAIDTADTATDPVTDTDTATDILSDADLPYPGICPIDHLEAVTSNNPFESASLLHPGEHIVANDACNSLAFDDLASGTNDCVDDDNCECQLVTDLGACTIDDPDHLRFSFLTGDRAWVRVLFEDGVDTSDLDFQLFKPAGVSVCDAFNLCTPPEQCLGGHCQRALVGAGWVDSNGHGGDDAYEYNIGAAAPGEGETDVLLEYVLRVKAFDSDIPYGVLVQVAPDSRDCAADPWDATWNVYDAASGNEVACAVSSCELSDGGTTLRSGNLCPWDRQDVFKYRVTVADPDRLFKVQWFSATETVTAKLYIERGENLELYGTLTSSGVYAVEQQFFDMEVGTYQLVVKSSRPTTFNASVTPID